MITKVVVPLDGSERAARATGPARALAERLEAPLVLMTTRWDDRGDEPREHLEGQAAGLGYERVETMVVQDRPAVAAILVQADEPGSVVCMSTRGRGGLRQAVLGSVAEDVLRHATRPVLLVGPGLERGAWESEHWFADGKLVVTVDGSTASDAILPAAAEWAGLLHLRPWVVEVIPDTLGIRAPRDLSPSPAVRRALDALAAADHAPASEAVEGEDVAASILDRVQSLGAALVAMVTHGRTGLARVALGSVAMRVVHDCPFPVLVMRSRDLAG